MRSILAIIVLFFVMALLEGAYPKTAVEALAVIPPAIIGCQLDPFQFELHEDGFHPISI